ncbi:archaeosortase/exosortase family protein [Piscinibacter sp. HJYY11]|uniref:archaeosortase/exosortase family protein n=1 Tax=Piscinibacter sp. HJYY11 TaxID=2801333 RepID=UPI00191CAC22|nr:archaeosortase/exosortase family protein [Piscinibacter sp. HJYY11]MBL0726206.1 archaeosortase/exosortase family protein [Piscinibacter sp. HJYY11]
MSDAINTPSIRGLPLRSLAWRALAFMLLFMAMQAGWEAARGSWVERLWVHHLTVQSATQVITTLTPEIHAVAKGPRITAPGGGINVLFGCEGTDVVFMLTAALLVFPMTWRKRLGGWIAGLAWVLVLNVLRIVVLFYAYRSDPGVFDLLHTAAAPLAMVVLTGLFFHLWLAHSSPAPSAAPAT